MICWMRAPGGTVSLSGQGKKWVSRVKFESSDTLHSTSHLVSQEKWRSTLGSASNFRSADLSNNSNSLSREEGRGGGLNLLCALDAERGAHLPYVKLRDGVWNTARDQSSRRGCLSERMRAAAVRPGLGWGAALLRGRAPLGHRRPGGKERGFGAPSPDGEAQVEPQGAVPVGPGDGSAERGPALCSQVPAKAAPVHAAHQQHRRAGDWVLQGEGGWFVLVSLAD